MTRDEIFNEMKQKLGIVPTFFKSISEPVLELEWNLFKKTELEEGLIPGKYKELIGLGIAAATRCRYCTIFHTEAAKLKGATDAEIEEAVYLAKMTAGWSSYVNGKQIDIDLFKKEVKAIVDHVRAKQAVAV